MTSPQPVDDGLPAVFAVGGPLARELPGFEERSCQTQMAEFVEAAIAAGERALVEAGTGTGKTLAYLVPALRAGHQTIVSTATKALQEQLWSHDLPLAQRLTETAVPVALIKGRANYLCLLSLDEQQQRPELGMQERLPRVQAWARSTTTGDMDELDVDASAEVRGRLTRGTDTCEGRLCPFATECWADKARATAAKAQVVVTNHHLLFADAKLRQAGGDDSAAMPLPDAPVVVLDEAHTLEDAMTSAFAAAIDGDRAARILNSVRVRQALAQRHLPVFSAALRAAAAAFESLDRRVGPGRTPIVEDVAAGRDLSRHAWTLVGAAEDIEDRHERTWVERRVRELAMDADLVFQPGDPDWVHYVDRDPTRGLVATAAPVAVDRLFARGLASKRVALLTSATLTVGDSFDYAKSRLALHGAQELITDPAFDYARQALLYVPNELPPPPSGGGASDAYDAAIADAIAGLADASRGRAFCLFTSYRALNDAWRRIGRRLPFPTFRQGDRPAGDLLRAFRDAGDGVLFGTRSFWEGVDVPGEALSLVIITRMPFAVPDDPVVAARTERMRQEGRDWFGEFALPRATLLLKQGFGRLIRSSADRGVVAILDSRIARRRYGATVLDSLPAARRTRDIADVREFFAI